MQVKGNSAASSGMTLQKEIAEVIARSADGQHYSSPELLGMLERCVVEMRQTRATALHDAWVECKKVESELCMRYDEDCSMSVTQCADAIAALQRH